MGASKLNDMLRMSYGGALRQMLQSFQRREQWFLERLTEDRLWQVTISIFKGNCELNIMATFDDFQKLDIRVGKIVEVEDFPEARKPSYKLKIDLGPETGIKKSCAQLCANYRKEDLTGKLVLCVVNFPPRQIGPATSEVLTLGVPGENNECVLIQPERDSPVGGKLY